MKVLDLQCGQGHSFEGWFSSEEDFQSQCQKMLVQCPLCSDQSVIKKLSAPRLNLTAQKTRTRADQQVEVLTPSKSHATDVAWLAAARKLMASTTDVGSQFAEEARKIHYGEAQERAIRGRATIEEARDLIEEGIAVVPLMLPESVKEPLQ
jgi:hypothetical protein